MSFLNSSFHKGVSGASILLASSLLSTPAAMASSSPAAPEPEIVNLSIVFMVDVSPSVDLYTEYVPMMKSLAQAMRSSETRQQLETGLVYAFSTVFFTGTAVHGDTFIIKSPEDAEKFAVNAIEAKITDRPLSLQSNKWGTSIVDGYEAVGELFEREAEMNFTSQSRAVLVIGDGMDNINTDPALVYAATMDFGRKYGAVVFGVPIVEAHPAGISKEALVSYFQANVVTQKGAYYIEPDGRKIPLRMGGIYPAYGFEDVNNAVADAMFMNPF